MAVAVAAKTSGMTEDDEAWLYGDSENGENEEPIAPGTGPEEQLPPPKEDTAVNEEKQQDAAVPKYNNDNEDSDDDEDDVQVTIGDIKAFPVTSAGGLFIGSSTYQKQPVVAGAGLKGTMPTLTKGVDVDGEGVINGIQLYEYTLDMLRDEDKPWRKPGADITDYFNYGFNEDTWRKYCHKQTRLRQESGAPMARFGSLGMLTPKLEPSDHTSPGMNRTQNPMSKSIQASPGTIAVLGSTTASRRPVEESINDVQLLGTLGDLSKPQMNLPPPGVPPSMGIPPPNYNMPPPGMPQMLSFSHAYPPGIHMLPPGMYVHPPPVPTFYPPHMAHPGPDARSFAERPPYGYDHQSPTINNYSDSQSSYPSSRSESHRERDRCEYKREKSPGAPGYSSDTSDDYRYSHSKEYSKDYERDSHRGQERSPRSRERSKSRSRDRSRSRERDRRYRDRDNKRDEKKPKRKVKAEPDDSDYYKSSAKHKTSKKSKRDKDGDSSDRGGAESGGT